jgi:hypoxanthine phosphoribosyltransferase
VIDCRRFAQPGAVWRWSTNLESQSNQSPSPEPQFSHPSEAEFADLLDYFAIPWQYEPRTFVLEQDEDGNPLEAFAPDFYLPEQDLYVEVTTLRQKLITRKNRKIRRLREQHPEINIKLFTRKDFRTLLANWGMIERHDEVIGQAALNNELNDGTDRASS